MVELWNGQPIQGGLTVTGFEVWLREDPADQLADVVAVHPGPIIPDDPGVMLVVTLLPGAGFSLEGLLDRPGMQVRTIGPQGDYDAAAGLARWVDRRLIRKGPGATIGGRRVTDLYRTGGAPSADRKDKADRTHFVCTYLVEIPAD